MLVTQIILNAELQNTTAKKANTPTEVFPGKLFIDIWVLYNIIGFGQILRFFDSQDSFSSVVLALLFNCKI